MKHNIYSFLLLSFFRLVVFKGFAVDFKTCKKSWKNYEEVFVIWKKM